MYYVLGNQGYMPYRYYVKTTIDSTFIQGWVNADDLAFSPSSDSEKEKTYEYEQQLYDAMEGNPIDTVEAGTYRILYYDIIRGETSEDSTYWYYIGKKNTDGSYEKLGWIKSLKDDEIEEIAKKKEREIEAATTIEEPEVYTYPDEVEEEPGVNGQTKDALLWLIIGASVVSIIIIVSLVIAKKHKDSKNTQNGDGPKGDEPAKGEGEQKETKKEEVKTDNPELEDDAKEGDAKIEEDTKAEEDVEENNTEESTEVENEVEEDRPEENGTEEDTKVEEDSTEEDVGDDVEAGEDDSD